MNALRSSIPGWAEWANIKKSGAPVKTGKE
jgi:hypothetical protein